MFSSFFRLTIAVSIYYVCFNQGIIVFGVEELVFESDIAKSVYIEVVVLDNSFEV